MAAAASNYGSWPATSPQMCSPSMRSPHAAPPVSLWRRYLTDLEAHAKPVNCVRFSPDGTMLASASVDGTIIIWKFDGLQRRWMQFTQLLIHTSDVVDLCWSPNSQFLFSGSMDDTAIVWDVNATGSAKVHMRFSDHQQYVQGVAWDPQDQLLLSVSSDRSVNAYKPKGGVSCACYCPLLSRSLCFIVTPTSHRPNAAPTKPRNTTRSR
jgi:WD40 repeat protein